jgi:hypothetical protein
VRNIDLISSFLYLLSKDFGYWKLLGKYIVAAIHTKRFHSLQTSEIIIIHYDCITNICIIYGYHWLIYLLLLNLIWILRFLVFYLRTLPLFLCDLHWTFSELLRLLILIINMSSIVEIAGSGTRLAAPHILPMSAILDLFVNHRIQGRIRLPVIEFSFLVPTHFLK